MDIVAVDSAVESFVNYVDQVAHQVFDEMCEWKIFDNFVICFCNFAY
jgi:hypothetical protein